MFAHIIVSYAIMGNVYFERLFWLVGYTLQFEIQQALCLSLSVSLSVFIYLSLSLIHSHYVVPAHTWKLQMTALSVKYMTPIVFPRAPPAHNSVIK